jgi:hypothetical protein
MSVIAFYEVLWALPYAIQTHVKSHKPLIEAISIHPDTSSSHFLFFFGALVLELLLSYLCFPFCLQSFLVNAL